jgi:hypothetical protein
MVLLPRGHPKGAQLNPGNLISNSLLAAASPGAGVVWALGGKQTLGECCQQTLGMVTAHG